MLNTKRVLPVIITGVMTVSIWSGIAFAEDKAMSLSLNDALKIALENNLDLKSSAFDLRSSELSLAETQANDWQKPSPTSILSAQTSLLVAQKNYNAAKTDLMINLSDSYFSLVKAQNLVKVYENAQKSSKDNLATVQAKLKAGVAAPLDQIKAESDLFTKETNLAKGVNNVQIAQLKLSQYMRTDAKQDLTLTTRPEYAPVKYDVEADLQKALATRTEMIQAQSTVDLRQKEVELNTNDYTAAITLEKSKISYEKAKIALDQQRDKIVNEVRQNYITLVDAYNKILSTQKSLDSAKESLRVTQLRYKANMAVNSEVIDAQNTVTQNETDLEGAIFDYQIANYKYLKSVGSESELK